LTIHDRQTDLIVVVAHAALKPSCVWLDYICDLV
jgi:hypothetical protein